MPCQIDDEYRQKASRIMKRNMSRQVPISGIFTILAGWRNLSREAQVEKLRNHALLDKKLLKLKKVVKKAFIEARDGNVIHIGFYETVAYVAPEKRRRRKCKLVALSR